MDEQNSKGDGERDRSAAGHNALAIVSALVVTGLLCAMGWKLGWVGSEPGMLSAKAVAMAGVGIVSLVAWAVKRR
ncbi:hypothetical protein ACFC0M_00505 [Streptomyces sp. NPDC056149]|uniref:hypothetical protein n=1 Tax=unclassified Streptomyces TaxID=2593676 RepID=UPI002380C7C7|nr:hypothetical protein [Streptomyces sp. WZ-12]